MIWAALFLLVWTVASLIWFVNVMGQKYRKVSKLQNVVEGIFGLPVLLIAYVLGYFLNRKK